MAADPGRGARGILEDQGHGERGRGSVAADEGYRKAISIVERVCLSFVSL